MAAAANDRISFADLAQAARQLHGIFSDLGVGHILGLLQVRRLSGWF